MAGRVELHGLDDLIRQVDRGMDPQKTVERALFAEAQTVLNESKKIVPVDTGTLKNSGRVERPKVSQKETSIEITYGGAAAGYALFVHENPTARHAPGKTYKFLEIPAMAHADKFVQSVQDRIFSYIRKGR